MTLRPTWSWTLLVFGLALSCQARNPGSFAVVCTFDPPPGGTVYLHAKVQDWSDAAHPVDLANSGQAGLPWSPGQSVDLVVDGVQNGANRVLLIEAREGSSLVLPAIYNGRSEPFELEAGDRITLDVAMTLAPPEVVAHVAERPVQLLFGGEPRARIGADQLETATLRLVTSGAVAVTLANDATFSSGAGLRENVALATGDGVSCTSAADPADATLEWTTCDLTGWDLSVGHESDGDSVRTVFAKLVDRYGYESRVFSDGVLVDTSAPKALAASLSPAFAHASQPIFLSVSFDEPIAEDRAMLTPRARSGATPLFTPAFGKPVRSGSSTTYVWRADSGTIDDPTTWAFDIAVEDDLGNASAPQVLVDGDGANLELAIDAAGPELPAQTVVVKKAGVLVDAADLRFGIDSDLPANANRLEIQFLLRDRNAPPLPASGLCDASSDPNCPQVLLGRRALGVLARQPEDDAEGLWGFRYVVDLTAGEWGAIEQALPLEVRWADAAGNTSESALPSPFVDFVRPTADCRVNLDPAKAGDVVRITATVSEPILPESSKLTANLGVTVNASLTDLSASRPRVTAEHVVSQGDPEAELAWQYDARDLAGNAGAGAALCSASSAVDGTAVGIIESSVETAFLDEGGGWQPTPAKVKDGGRVTVRFTLDDTPAEGSVRVTIDDAPVQACTINALTTTCVVDVDREASLPWMAEGPAPVLVDLQDDAGNRTVQLLATILRDFTPPSLAGLAHLERVDGYGRSQMGPDEVATKNGSSIAVTFALTEPAHELPSLALAGNVVAPTAWDSDGGFGTATIPAPATEGRYELTASVRDAAGNAADLVLGHVDHDPVTPAALSGAGQAAVRLFRAPWGCAETNSDATSEVRVCPADGTTPPAWSDCPSLPTAPFEPGALLRVTKRTHDEGVSECTGDVLAEGEIAPEGHETILTIPGDWPSACVSQTDAAGNESPGVLVKNVEWVATLNGKVAGSRVENPHRLVRIPAPGAAAGAEVISEPSTADLAGVAAPDGDASRVSAERLWRRLDQSDERPEARYDTAMAWDAGRGRLVVFGGWAASSSGLSDTWEWNGSVWQRASTEASFPGGRSGHQMVYDGQRGRVVLFGGAGYADLKSDLWEWDGTSWAERWWTGSGPVARTGFGLAFDRSRGVVVLFGGLRYDDLGTPVVLDDLWEWDGTSWAARCDGVPTVDACASRPEARQQVSLAWDDANQRVVLFGGEAATETLLSDTWTWNGTAWKKASPVAHPAERKRAALAFDEERQTLVLIGGEAGAAGACGGPRRYCRDAWEWSGAEWKPGVAPTAFADRAGAALAWDGALHGLAVVGGGVTGDPDEATTSFRDDQWLLDDAGWRDVTARGLAPDARDGQALAYDPVRDRVVLFGGTSAAGALDDTWEFDGVRWERRCDGDPATDVCADAPSRRARGALAYDSSRETVILFGGSWLGADLADTWEWDGLSWVRRCDGVPAADTCASRPGGRQEHALAFDAQRGRVVMFGGRATGGPSLNETWEWTGDDWEERCDGSPSADDCTPPEARRSPALAFDATRGRTVLFGGLRQDFSEASDTWEWDGTDWTRVEDGSAGVPPARMAAGLAFDGARSRTVLFGGTSFGAALSDTWEWDGLAWHDLSGPTDPVARVLGAPLVWDGLRARALLFGGSFAGNRSDVTWRWDGRADLPAALDVEIDWSKAEASGATVGALDVLAVAGATGSLVSHTPGPDGAVVGAASDGAELLAWDAAAGAWRLLDSSSASADEPSALSWSSDSASAPAHSFVAQRDGLVRVRLQSATGSGNGRAPATLGADYVEVRVRYSW